jgi:hypothetical protein
MPITNGTRILADGETGLQRMRYDEKSMRFWRTGRLEITPSVAEQERNHIEDEAEVARLVVELDTIIQHKMAHETLERKQYDLALALYLECKKSSIGFGNPARHRRQRVLRTFEDQFLKYPSK